MGAILAGLVGGRFFKLAWRVVIARLLGASALGLFDLGWTVALILSFVAPLGLQQAVVRFGASLWQRDRGAFRLLVQRCISLSTFAGLVGAVCLFLSADFLTQELLHQPELSWILKTFALMVPLAGGLEVLTAATRATQSMRYTVILRDLLQPVVQFFLFLVFLSMGMKLGGAIWAVIGGYAVAGVLALRVVVRLVAPDERPAGPGPPMDELLGFSIPAAASTVVTALRMWSDRIIIGYYWSPIDVGIYSAAAQLSMLLALLQYGLVTAFTPMFVRYWQQGERDRGLSLLNLCTRWGIIVLSPIASVLIVGPSVALEAVFGREFGGGASVLLVLSLGQSVNVVSGPVGAVLLSTGRERNWVWLNCLAFVTNIAMNLLLVPHHGIMGAAWASAGSTVVLFAGAVWSVFRLEGHWPWDRRLWKVVPAAVVAFTSVWWVQGLEVLRPIWSLGASVAIATLTTVLTLGVLGLEPEDRVLLQSLLRWQSSRGPRA
jgi:O-antigen/teichoic acid export membrane protein